MLQVGSHSLPSPHPFTSSLSLVWSVYHDSINHWSLVAIIVAVRIELRNLYLKCQRGLLEIPQDDEVVNDWFFRQVLEAIPIQLRRHYSSSSHSRHRKSKSGGGGGGVCAEEQVTFLLDEIRSCLTFENEEIEFPQASRMELQLFLFQSVKLIDARLLRELNEVSHHPPPPPSPDSHC
jgi:hypothetical protein